MCGYEYHSDCQYYGVGNVVAEDALQYGTHDVRYYEYHAHQYHLDVVVVRSVVIGQLLVKRDCLLVVDCHLEQHEILESHSEYGIAYEHEHRPLAGYHHRKHQQERHDEQGRHKIILCLQDIEDVLTSGHQTVYVIAFISHHLHEDG